MAGRYGATDNAGLPDKAGFPVVKSAGGGAAADYALQNHAKQQFAWLINASPMEVR